MSRLSDLFPEKVDKRWNDLSYAGLHCFYFSSACVPFAAASLIWLRCFTIVLSVVSRFVHVCCCTVASNGLCRRHLPAPGFRHARVVVQPNSLEPLNKEATAETAVPAPTAFLTPRASMRRRAGPSRG